MHIGEWRREFRRGICARIQRAGAAPAATAFRSALDGPERRGHYSPAFNEAFMSIGTRIAAWLFGEFVGQDPYGNRYYRMRGGKRAQRERRWVIYAGEAEASKVPQAWHAWLHHTVASPPTEQDQKPYSWIAPHMPNMTGTPGAYRPPGHVLAQNKRPRATGDYEPWRPS
jgi:NADH:ubiquinone oxidoreductase subunit